MAISVPVIISFYGTLINILRLQDYSQIVKLNYIKDKTESVHIGKYFWSRFEMIPISMPIYPYLFSFFSERRTNFHFVRNCIRKVHQMNLFRSHQFLLQIDRLKTFVFINILPKNFLLPACTPWPSWPIRDRQCDLL